MPVWILEKKKLQLLGGARRYLATANGAREVGVLEIPDGHCKDPGIQALKDRGCDIEGHVSSSSECRCNDLP
jgi:hypothetical protein